MITPSRPTVLGVPVSPGTHDDLRSAIAGHIRSGNGLLHVVTANPEYVMAARRDPSFAAAIASAGIVTVDGAGLAIAIRLLHPTVTTERYTGVSLTPDLAQISAETGAGVFLLGAGPGVADRAADVLRADFPGAHIVGTWSDGTPSPDDDVETLDRLAASGARIVLVAYGAPAQIHWIRRNAAALDNVGVLVVAGIGGALDYISGTTPLPPAIIRRSGMEWLYRLAREPHRWRRQLVLPQFGVLVLAAWLKSRVRGGVE